MVHIIQVLEQYVFYSFRPLKLVDADRWKQPFKVCQSRGKPDSKAQTLIWHDLGGGVQLILGLLRA